MTFSWSQVSSMTRRVVFISIEVFLLAQIWACSEEMVSV